jgi:hypothetical protein
METPADHSAPDTHLVVASLGSADVDDVRADLSVLPLDHHLVLQLDGASDLRDLADSPEDAYPAFDDSDLPAPSFHDDDLPAPSFHDDDLPAPSLHDYDMPADLTTFGLGRLLGLELGGTNLPTVGEVFSAPSLGGEADEAEPKEADDDNGNEETANPGEGDASPEFSDVGDLSFIDPQTFTEQAETNNAKSASGHQIDAELFGRGLAFPDEEGEFDDDFFDRGSAVDAPVDDASRGSSGSGGSGEGTNVINGSAGDDVLNGSAGGDLIHGFAGNDIIDGGAGSDRLDGGLGDDVLIWDSADTKIDGKIGTDTLWVDGSDADFTNFGGTISGLEIVDLQSDGGDNTVTLTAQEVLDATDNANILIITGDDDDTVNAGNGWTDGGADGGGNQIYTQIVGAFTATLVVDLDINVNTDILM